MPKQVYHPVYIANIRIGDENAPFTRIINLRNYHNLILFFLQLLLNIKRGINIHYIYYNYKF